MHRISFSVGCYHRLLLAQLWAASTTSALVCCIAPLDSRVACPGIAASACCIAPRDFRVLSATDSSVARFRSFAQTFRPSQQIRVCRSSYIPLVVKALENRYKIVTNRNILYVCDRFMSVTRSRSVVFRSAFHKQHTWRCGHPDVTQRR